MTTALDFATTLLSLAADPDKARARLKELAQSEGKISNAILVHDSAKRGAEAAAKKLANLESDRAGLVQRANELDRKALEQSVASAAHQERHKALDTREQQLHAREQQIAARERVHEQKLAEIRAQLS
jgi:hypothetical protein